MEEPITTLFQTTIEHLLRSLEVLEQFQAHTDFHVRFDMPDYDRLVIERHDSLISVAHYFEQNGDLIADPEIDLHYPSWTPTAITQILGYRRTKFIELDGQILVDTGFQHEVSSFLAMWARNIQAQGWIEQGNIYEDANDPR